jgi:hypothetical protein
MSPIIPGAIKYFRGAHMKEIPIEGIGYIPGVPGTCRKRFFAAGEDLDVVMTDSERPSRLIYT